MYDENAMHIAIPHKTARQKAVEKVKDALEKGRAQIAEHAKIGEERWEGDTLHFSVDLQGKTITGTLAVEDADYVLDAKLPLLWRMFEGRIEAEISRQVGRLA